MKDYIFSAISLEGDKVYGTSVINKHKRLYISNEARAGHWIYCKVGTLEVIEVDVNFKNWFSLQGVSNDLQAMISIFDAMDDEDKLFS